MSTASGSGRSPRRLRAGVRQQRHRPRSRAGDDQALDPGGRTVLSLARFNPLNGFSLQGRAPKRSWTLSDAERARTGIEHLVFDEGANNTGGVSLRDFHATLPDADFSTVNVEITIGTGASADKLTGAAHLVEKPAGSGRWTL